MQCRRSLIATHGLFACCVGLILGTIGFLEAEPLAAQRPNLRHFSSKDGLVQSQVLASLQSRTGYLWFGNYGGLNRFDGRRFVWFSSLGGLRSNTVLSLAETADGRLVVGLASGGVCLISDVDGAYEHAQVHCPHGDRLAEDDVNGLLVDTDGQTIWAATNRGLARISETGVRRFGEEDGLPSPVCHGVTRWDGSIWVATDGGLARWDGERFARLAELADIPPALRSPTLEVLGLPEGLVVGSRGRVHRLVADGDSYRATSYSLPGPLSKAEWEDLASDGGQGVWIATNLGAVHWPDLGKGELDILTRQQGLRGLTVNSVTVDHERNVWLGTDFGVSRVAFGPFLVYGTAAGLPNIFVRAITGDSQGRVWMGTRDGVVRFGAEGELPEIIPIDPSVEPRVYSMAETRDGSMWIGTRSGLVRHRESRGGATREWTYRREDGLPSDYITSLLADPSGGLWLASDRGLGRWDDGPDGGTLRLLDGLPGLEDAYVYAMAYGPDDQIWLGRRSGGVMVVDWRRSGPVGPGAAVGDGVGGVIIESAERLDFTDLTVWDIDRAADGSMWVGTNGDGIFRIGTDGVRQWTTKDGLVDDFIWQVLCDSTGSVWLYTNRGLDRFDGSRFEHFDLGDGLPDPEGAAGAAFEDAAGHLWFGTASGVARYDAVEVEHEIPPPVAVIQEVRPEQGGLLESGAVLPAGSGSIGFTFAALSFRDVSEIRYRYRLLGSSQEWSKPTTEATVTFANTGPGHYRFEVVGSNENGVWSQQPAVFEFEIRPVFWQTQAFRMLCALLFVGLVWLAARLRTRHLEMERWRLEDLVGRRTRELARKNESLEREIEDRSRAEAERSRLEERLRQSEKMEAVGRLAGGVAHDFNNLLTTISGYGDLLLDQLGEDHELKPEVDEILGAAERAARLTQQLLAFSRKQVIEPRTLHINEVVTDISRMLRRLIGEDVELRTDLQARPDTVHSDRGQLEQVLLNLVVNARDSMPDGGRLRIRTSVEHVRFPRQSFQDQEIAPGFYVVLEVEDSGHGMAPELLDRIFEPFFTTKETGKGTGLGLATVYGIVRQTGGYIDVDSDVGEGTLFTLRMPLSDETPTDPQASGIFSSFQLESVLTVLVVEDEETVRRLVCGVLSRYGYEVLEAENGTQAFEISKRFPNEIHLLLTDVVMPEIDGHVVAEELSKERPAMQVLYVSGYPDDFLGKRGILPEGTNFLNKPFTPKKLIKKVREVLGRQ